MKKCCLCLREVETVVRKGRVECKDLVECLKFRAEVRTKVKKLPA